MHAKSTRPLILLLIYIYKKNKKGFLVFVTYSKNLVIGLLSLMFAFSMPVLAGGHKSGHEGAGMKTATKADMDTPVYTQVVFQKLKK